MIKTFYGNTLEECLEEANNFGREIIHFQYEVVTNYPTPCYRLIVVYKSVAAFVKKSHWEGDATAETLRTHEF